MNRNNNRNNGLRELIDGVAKSIEDEYGVKPNYVYLKSLIKRFVKLNPHIDPENIDWVSTYDPELEYTEMVKAFKDRYPMYKWDEVDYSDHDNGDYYEYLEEKMNEYNNEEKKDEEMDTIKEEIENLKTSIQNLENKILDRSNWLNDYFSRELKEVREDIEAIRREKNTIIARSIESIRREVKDEIDKTWNYKIEGLKSYIESIRNPVTTLDNNLEDIEKTVGKIVDEKMKPIVSRISTLEEIARTLNEELEDLGGLKEAVGEMIDEKLKSVKPTIVIDPDRVVDEIISRVNLDEIIEKKISRIEEKIKAVEEMVTYATKRSVEYVDELKKSNQELKERYLDLSSKYESLIELVEKASTPTRQTQLQFEEQEEGKRTEGKLDLDELVRLGILRTAKPKRKIDWKKIGVQIAKGVYLGLICLPLLPFLPLLYSNLVKQVRSEMKTRTRKDKRGAEVWLKQ